jgi:hypothetical protein
MNQRGRQQWAESYIVFPSSKASGKCLVILFPLSSDYLFLLLSLFVDNVEMFQTNSATTPPYGKP